MEQFILYKGEIQGRYKEVQIYPLPDVKNVFLVHWDGFEIGKIKKKDGKWITKSADLIPVVKELGALIDARGMNSC